MIKTKMKPIIFSGPSIPVIQNLKPGTWPPEPIDPGKPFKWQTRRAIKPQPEEGYFIGPCGYSGSGWSLWEKGRHGKPDGCTCTPVKCPYPPGTRLYVKEAWAWLPSWNCDNNMCNCETVYKDELGCFNYRANYGTTRDDSFPPDTFKWKSSRFMPKAAARLFLEVKSVRPERLQEISHEDAIAEGVMQWICEEHKSGSYLDNAMRGAACAKPERAFALLWDSIYGKNYPWKNNDWVWVYEFMRTERQAKP